MHTCLVLNQAAYFDLRAPIQPQLARGVPCARRRRPAANQIKRPETTLAHNVAMKKALGALSGLLNDKSKLAYALESLFVLTDSACSEYWQSSRPECPDSLYPIVVPSPNDLIAKATKDKGLSTRFWYYLDHTATNERT